MLTQGNQAPALDLPDLDGRRHNLLEDLTRGPALAVFWKPACSTCHLAFPYLQRLYETLPASDWTLLAVSQADERSTRDFATQHGLAFPLLIEGESWPASRSYDPDATPTFFLISPSGVIQMVSVGFHKTELNEIAAKLGEAAGVDLVELIPGRDGSPPFKPG